MGGVAPPPVSRISGFNRSESDLRGHSRGGTVCFTDGPERLSHQSRTARKSRNFRRRSPLPPHRAVVPEPLPRPHAPHFSSKTAGKHGSSGPNSFTARRRSRSLSEQEAGAAALLGRESSFIKAQMKWFPLKALVGLAQLQMLDEPPNNGNHPGANAS